MAHHWMAPFWLCVVLTSVRVKWLVSWGVSFFLMNLWCASKKLDIIMMYLIVVLRSCSGSWLASVLLWVRRHVLTWQQHVKAPWSFPFPSYFSYAACNSSVRVSWTVCILCGILVTTLFCARSTSWMLRCLPDWLEVVHLRYGVSFGFWLVVLILVVAFCMY